MSTSPTGVYAVYENQFKVGTAGRSSTAEQMLPIADMETFSVSFENGRETWTPMDTKGWERGLVTGKKMTISLKGKRHLGDPGNDYIAGLAMLTGNSVKTHLDWTFYDGTVAHIPVDVSVTNVGTGDSTNVGPLEFECTSDGVPEVTLPEATE